MCPSGESKLMVLTIRAGRIRFPSEMNVSLLNRPRLQSGLAAAMVFLFLQGFVGTFVHFEVVDHYWCAEHQHATHDEDHAGAGQTETASNAVQPADSHQSPDPAPDKDDGPDCHWLTWVEKTSISMPTVAAGHLDLPPPASLDAPRIPSSQTSEPSPIALRHLSPINSPPHNLRG